MDNELLTENRRVVFTRRGFSLLVIHWALVVLAAPIVTVWGNKTVFGVYWMLGFFGLVMLTLATSARHFNGRAGHRPVHPKLRRLARLAAVVSIVMAVLSACCIFVLWFVGRPFFRDGVYIASLQNDAVIREITREEYLRLSIVERGMFCSGLSTLSGIFLHISCHADAIE